MRLFAAFASIAGIVLVSACSGFTELGVGAGKAGMTGDAGSGMSNKAGKGGNSSGGSQGSDATSGTSGSSTGGSTADGGSNATGGSTANGGSNATGGSTADGGSNATGGTNATGGSNATGGTNTTGGSGSTAGSSGSGAVIGSGAGGSGSNATPPRFLLIGPLDPSGSLQAGREYTVGLNGASDDGSVLVGSSTFYEAATSTNDGVFFYWTEASGVVPLAPPASTPLNQWIHVSPDGTSLFGFYGAGVFGWTKQAGYEFFVASWPVPPPNGGVEISLSRDGTAAWGIYWDLTQSYGFRWRRTDGLVTSGSIPGWPADGLYAEVLQSSSCCGNRVGGYPSSDDGKVVAGYHYAPEAQLVHGFIWLEPGTLAELGPLPGTSACTVSALSRDGTTAFGSCAQDRESTGTPFRWTASTGTVAIGAFNGSYTDTTRDGRVAMGGDGTNTLSRWTADSGEVRLQPSPNTIDPAQYGLSMTAGSLSDDGGSVYGKARRIDLQAVDEEEPEDAFRWSAAEGFVLLPPLPGYDIATVLAAAPDGSVQVGQSRSRIGGNASLPSRAVMWDCLGIRDIGAELAAGGIDLPEGGLTAADGVWSGASIMIVGVALYPWIAWLPRRC